MVKLMVEGDAMVDLYHEDTMLEEMNGYVMVDMGMSNSAKLTAMSMSDPDLMDGDMAYKAWKLMDGSSDAMVGDDYWFRVDVRGSTAVPALPLVGQLLLALFLMAGGSRLYRRHQRIAPSSTALGGTVYGRGEPGANAPGSPLKCIRESTGVPTASSASLQRSDSHERSEINPCRGGATCSLPWPWLCCWLRLSGTAWAQSSLNVGLSIRARPRAQRWKRVQVCTNAATPGSP